jgi:hypothetical protein
MLPFEVLLFVVRLCIALIFARALLPTKDAKPEVIVADMGAPSSCFRVWKAGRGERW